MGATLEAAAAANAYTLTDRGTWLSSGSRGKLKITVEGDKVLMNQYGVILVNPERFRNVRANAGRAFIDWLTSPAGQNAIAEYEVGGEQVFFPNAAG